MRLTEIELGEIVRSQTAGHRTAPRQCLSEDLLLRAAAKELDGNEREQVASHLAVCSDCVRDYRIAHSVRSWAEQAATSDESQRLDRMPGQRAPDVRVLAQARTRNWRIRTAYRRLIPYSVAASLATVAVLGGWLVFIHRNDVRNLEHLNAQLADRDRAIQELQQSVDDARRLPAPEGHAQPGTKRTDALNSGASDEGRLAELRGLVSELSKPSFNVPIVDVEPSRARGGTGAATTIVEVPKSASLFALILHTSGQVSDAGYSLEILDASGKLIFRGNGMKNTADSGLTVALSRRMMPSGRYDVRLYDLKRLRTEPIEQYVVEVHYR